MNPRLATSAVIKTVRKQLTATSGISGEIEFSNEVSLSFDRQAETRIILLRTETPDKVINPTAAEIDNGMSRAAIARTPPTHANGTLEKTMRVSIVFR